MKIYLADLGRNVRSAIRNPGFSLAILITLALGIGSTAAILAVVDSLLLKSLPYPHPGELVKLTWVSPPTFTPRNLNAKQVFFWENHTRSFQSLAIAFPSSGCNLVGGSDAVYVSRATVSTNFFKMFEIVPFLGRDFLPQESLRGGEGVAIISYRLWKQHFGGSGKVLERQIECNGRPYLVVGVLPRAFWHSSTADIWVPDRIENHLQDEGSNYEAVGRLKSTVTVAAAQLEMSDLAAQFRTEYSATDQSGEWGIRLFQYHQWVVSEVRKPLLLLFASVILVLMIACSNVAGLILARAADSRNDIAIRRALGARTSHILTHLLSQHIVLTIVGAGFGIILAVGILQFLNGVLALEYPMFAAVSLDGLAVACTFGVAVCTAMIAALLSALRSTGFIAMPSGQRTTSVRTVAQNRGRKILIVSEVALSLLLLISSGLFAKSFVLLSTARLGFDPENVEVAQLSLGSEQYSVPLRVADFEEHILSRIRTLPGIVKTAAVSSIPFQPGLNLPLPEVGGHSCGEDALEYRAVSPEYFATMNIPMLRGRGVTDADTGGSTPIIVINQAMARRCWTTQDPLSSQIQTGKGFEALHIEDIARQVVGIVGDTKEYSLDQPEPPMVFVPQAQLPVGLNAALYQSLGFRAAIVVRTNYDTDLSTELQTIVRKTDPRQPIITVRKMADIISDTTALNRFSTQTLGFFAGFSIILTISSLYGLLNYHVTQRSHEIGLRIALGALSSDVLRMVVWQGTFLVLLGTGIGLAAALAVTRFVSGLLYGIQATDPSVWIIATAAFVSVAIFAMYAPARKASKLDPSTTLRHE